jgi:hypothetical protein
LAAAGLPLPVEVAAQTTESAGHTKIVELRRPETPYYATADSREPAGTISSTAEFAEGGKILGSKSSRFRVAVEGAGEVWFLSAFVKTDKAVASACIKKQDGNEQGGAVGAGMADKDCP